jgi:hypothetical protein
VTGPTVVSGAVLPEMRLDHLTSITDDTGIIRHVRFQTPVWQDGYTTDDNARALIVAVRNQGATNQWDADRYLGRYLAFLANAQLPDGLFRNYLSYDRRWGDEPVSEDCCGRCIWAAGYTLRHAERAAHQSMAKEILERALPAAADLGHLRAKSYSIFGLAAYHEVFGGAREARTLLTRFADDLVAAFRATADSDWAWFENQVTYGNGNLPHSLFVAAEAIDHDEYREIALASLGFLDQILWRDGRLSLVGQDGWYVRGGRRARFDQQPIDAVAMVRAYQAAYNATGHVTYLTRMRKAFDWFLGDNDLGQSPVDFTTGACADGLTPTGLRQDHGAESTLAYLNALSYTQDIQGEETTPEIEDVEKADQRGGAKTRNAEFGVRS